MPDEQVSRSPRKKFLGREYFDALITALLLALFARTFVVQAFKIPSASMERNLIVGDHILVNKFVYGSSGTGLGALLPSREVRRGDIVVFKFPQEPWRDFIKRCVALPGDAVELIDRDLYVNGISVEEPYTYYQDQNVVPRSHFVGEERFRSRDNYGPYTVPPSHYFCLGDNRDYSNDSRFWGPVPAKMVKGRAFAVYWSFRAPSPEEAAESSGLLARLKRIPGATRWERTFQVVR